VVSDLAGVGEVSSRKLVGEEHQQGRGGGGGGRWMVIVVTQKSTIWVCFAPDHGWMG